LSEVNRASAVCEGLTQCSGVPAPQAASCGTCVRIGGFYDIAGNRLQHTILGRDAKPCRYPTAPGVADSRVATLGPGYLFVESGLVTRPFAPVQPTPSTRRLV
jgi:hypothetical protein